MLKPDYLACAIDLTAASPQAAGIRGDIGGVFAILPLAK